MTGVSAADLQHTAEPSCILLVEDEILIRLVIADLLRDEGFRVLEAANGEEAIAILSGRTDIDLVLTDVKMPGSIDGLDLARTVRGQARRIKVIVVSGHLEHHESYGLAHAFVPKPYDLEAMVRKVREVLENTSGYNGSE